MFCYIPNFPNYFCLGLQVIKRTSRTRRTCNSCHLEFGIVWISYLMDRNINFNLTKGLKGWGKGFACRPLWKGTRGSKAGAVMRQNGRGGLHQFPTPLLNLFSFSQVTQEARLAVKWPCRLSCAGYCKHANISRGGSRKFRKGWPGHLPAI